MSFFPSSFFLSFTYLLSHPITLFTFVIIPSLSPLSLIRSSPFPCTLCLGFTSYISASHLCLHPLHHFVSPCHIHSSNRSLSILLSSSRRPFPPVRFMSLLCSFPLCFHRLVFSFQLASLPPSIYLLPLLSALRLVFIVEH